ncbi:hypothetical protein OHA18_03210 [Kribbella sp. NBC_00709]|uniref:hypothetical protein n=1 Tax=Kribbella sp. NBC_00709 TaxID=2975972 RepID=UPI002E290292|nr:hypothetical protein [Kribbella sp. NBC_00709]
MNAWQPSPGAKQILDKLVTNVIDWGELNVHHNMAGVSFDASAGPLGAVHPDGSMVFDDSIGRAFESAAERPQALSSDEVAELRHAIRVVTFTALDKRIENRETEGDGPIRMALDAGSDADRFLNDGLRHADWAVSGDRICFRLSPELSSRLQDTQEGEPEHPVAREAAVALAAQYARARGEWPDNAVRDLLKGPREQAFERVVDAKLAAQLREKFEPAREALSDLRARLTDDVRTEFQRLAEEPQLAAAEVQGRVAAVCGRVDDSARTVKETLSAMPLQQADRSSTAAAADRAQPATKHRWTGFGR